MPHPGAGRVGRTARQLFGGGGVSPVARFRFEDSGDATTLTDSVGSYDGSVSGMSYLSDPGGRGSEAGETVGDFDGTDDSADIPLGSTLFQGDYTITLWFYYPDTVQDNVALLDCNDNVALAKGDNQNSATLEFWINSRGAVAYTDNNNVGDNRWDHATARREGDQHRLYVNGNKVDSFTGTPNETTDSTLLALRDIGGYMNVHLDDLRFYDTAISESLIADIANGDA